MAAMMEEVEHDEEMEEESTSNSIALLEQHGINNGDVNKVRACQGRRTSRNFGCGGAFISTCLITLFCLCG